MRLYEMADSGNCYKIRLLLNKLGIDYERVPTDIMSGASRTPEFLARNANGKVPTLELDDGRHLAESNAILGYLAEGTPYLPAAGFERALVYQWLFFEQYSHERFIATNRFWIHLEKSAEKNREAIARNRPQGYAALTVMNSQLASRPFFVGASMTIADIALYAYTHVADEGGFELEPYPHVQAWLRRVAAEPRHIPIDA